MDTEIFLKNVCQEIKYNPVKDNISKELEGHIEEIKEGYIKDGIEEKEAEEKAVKQMGDAQEIGKKLNKIHRPKTDWKLIILITILTIFGIAISMLKQTNMEKYEINKMLIYIIIVILILSMSEIKNTINGVPVLNIIGAMSLRPCTIVIPMYIIAFVGFIMNYNNENKISLNIIEKTIIIQKDLLKIVTLSIISLILIGKVPSTANAIILGIIYLIITTIQILRNKEKSKNRIKLIYGIVSVCVIIVAIIKVLSEPYTVARWKNYLNPEDDQTCDGYEGMLQREILENANLIGEADTEIINDNKNIINSRNNNTFIYLLGKVGILISSTLIITIILTSIRLIRNAKNIKEIYGKYLIIGLSSLYIIQSIVNILTNLNLGIKTDIDLPFVSYGGQYFIINLVSMSIILSIYRRKNIILEN